MSRFSKCPESPRQTRVLFRSLTGRKQTARQTRRPNLSVELRRGRPGRLHFGPERLLHGGQHRAVVGRVTGIAQIVPLQWVVLKIIKLVHRRLRSIRIEVHGYLPAILAQTADWHGCWTKP